MLPREHGAYGQLLLSIATAMAMGRPSIATAAIAVSAVAGFVAHEPALVLLGRRGGRTRREQHVVALRWLAGCSVVALVAGVTALVLLPTRGRVLTLVPMAGAACAIAVLLSGAERTTAGEVVVSTALASISLPMAVASGATLSAALTCAATFAAIFAAATVSVHAVIAGAHGADHGERRVAFAISAMLWTVVGALVFARVIPPAALWAASPVCGVALALAVLVPPPRYLRQIGWTLVAATAVTSGILVAAMR